MFISHHSNNIHVCNLAPFPFPQALKSLQKQLPPKQMTMSQWNKQWRLQQELCTKSSPLPYLVGYQRLKVQGPKVQRLNVQRLNVPGLKVQSPKAQGPKVQMPKSLGPKVQGPKVQGPKVQIPKSLGPKVQGPKVQGPKVQIPKYLGQKVQIPKSLGPRRWSSHWYCAIQASGESKPDGKESLRPDGRILRNHYLIWLWFSSENCQRYSNLLWHAKSWINLLFFPTGCCWRCKPSQDDVQAFRSHSGGWAFEPFVVLGRSRRGWPRIVKSHNQMDLFDGSAPAMSQ